MSTTETNQVYNQEQSTRTAHQFTRRIGSTTYKVEVRFSTTSKENLKDKIIRLLRYDAAKVVNK
jgi:hypothetical protein